MRRTNVNVWLGTLGMFAGTGALWWGTYVEFSWDIMEPVTFFCASFFGAVGCVRAAAAMGAAAAAIARRSPHRRALTGTRTT